tara:strand:- start:1043 stop:1678 length:636 start_codon:yes stop_codon:yes gene_type:complete
MNNEFKKRLFSSIFLIPISIFLIIKGSIFFICFLSFLFLATSYEWVKMSEKNILLKFLGILFLFFSFYAAFEIRGDENFKDFIFIITICVFTDIGGYIFGKILKGPKLTRISPKKTYAGVFGGFLLSLLAGLVFNHYLYVDQKFFNKESSLFEFILFISLISQLGDLIISYFKRKAKIKDTGKILPGHGGILDRLDGMIFVFPICFLITIL